MPSLGEATADKREKEEADEFTLNELQSQSHSLRLSMIAEGKRDEMKMIQPKYPLFERRYDHADGFSLFR